MSRFLGLGRASEGFNCRRRHSSWEAAQRRSPRSFPKERANSQSYNCRKGSGQNSPSQDRISFLRLWQGTGEALRPACAVDCMSDQDFLTLSPRKRKMTGPVVMSVTWESRAGHRLMTGVTLILKVPGIADPARGRHHWALCPRLDRRHHRTKAWATMTAWVFEQVSILGFTSSDHTIRATSSSYRRKNGSIPLWLRSKCQP